MDCNKEDAIRAKEMAEKRFAENDFVGAQMIAIKAKSLFPQLEGISQLLATLEVFVASENKFNDEPDWYQVLNVDPYEPDEVIKKQYRKLALLLHPDKNKSVGADGAFKLISEAWSMLSEKSSRAGVDQRRYYRPAYNSMNNGAATPEKDFVSELGKSSTFKNNGARSSNGDFAFEREKSSFFMGSGGGPTYSDSNGFDFFHKTKPKSSDFMGSDGAPPHSNADGFKFYPKTKMSDFMGSKRAPTHLNTNEFNFYPKTMQKSNDFMGSMGAPTHPKGHGFDLFSDGFNFFNKTTPNSSNFMGTGRAPTHPNADSIDSFAKQTAKPGVYIGSESMPPPTNTNGFKNFSKRQHAPRDKAAKRARKTKQSGSSSAPHPKPETATYWTMCERCKMRYEYEVYYRNLTILCLICNEPFIAVVTSPPASDVGNDGVGSSHHRVK